MCSTLINVNKKTYLKLKKISSKTGLAMQLILSILVDAIELDERRDEYIIYIIPSKLRGMKIRKIHTITQEEIDMLKNKIRILEREKMRLERLLRRKMKRRKKKTRKKVEKILLELEKESCKKFIEILRQHNLLGQVKNFLHYNNPDEITVYLSDDAYFMIQRCRDQILRTPSLPEKHPPQSLIYII